MKKYKFEVEITSEYENIKEETIFGLLDLHLPGEIKVTEILSEKISYDVYWTDSNDPKEPSNFLCSFPAEETARYCMNGAMFKNSGVGSRIFILKCVDGNILHEVAALTYTWEVGYKESEGDAENYVEYAIYKNSFSLEGLLDLCNTEKQGREVFAEYQQKLEYYNALTLHRMIYVKGTSLLIKSVEILRDQYLREG